MKLALPIRERKGDTQQQQHDNGRQDPRDKDTEENEIEGWQLGVRDGLRLVFPLPQAVFSLPSRVFPSQSCCVLFCQMLTRM